MTDIEIAQKYSKNLPPIIEVAQKLNIPKECVECFGNDKAKIDYSKIKSKNNSKLILVTAINPTSAGEGKTTVSIGLADALNLIGKKTILALREPSLGPVFGIKGGATGGGFSQIVPMEEINLHFTGDFHAITSANNLLSAMIDNHIFQGNELKLDENNIYFNRCMDMNDRALRNVVVGNSGNKKEIARNESFNITAASEIMAIMCLAKDIEDLKRRCGNITIGLNKKGQTVYAKDLKAENAMAILLKQALKPNLVQSLGGTPALVHCGPFANIAHGCNSIIATKLAQQLSDYVVTEAGFGADLGAEKFLDLKCQVAKLTPNAVVLVATIRALKLHGGVAKEDLLLPNMAKLKIGTANLIKHLNNIKNIYNLPCVVALNKFDTDSEEEINLVKNEIDKHNTKVIPIEVWSKGGKGALQLANEVVDMCNQKSKFTPCYKMTDDIKTKINKICTQVYGAKDVVYTEQAEKSLNIIKQQKLENYPVVIAKTQYSLSDNPKLLNVPADFVVTIRDLQIRSGSEFIVALAGDMLLMPGLSKTPAAVNMTIDKNGNVKGLF